MDREFLEYTSPCYVYPLLNNENYDLIIVFKLEVIRGGGILNPSAPAVQDPPTWYRYPQISGEMFEG